MTRWNVLTALAVLALPAAATAGQRHVPPQLTQARYVALGFDTGDGFIHERAAIGHPELIAERDLEALAELRARFVDWDRFVLADRPEQADILVGVRTSRKAVFEIGGRIGHDDPGARGARSQAPTLGAEASSPGDTLSVYQIEGGAQPGMLLWRERRSGDDFPGASFERFKADVEKSVPKP